MFIKLKIIREIDGKQILQPSIQQVCFINRFYTENGKTYLEYVEKDSEGFNLADLVEELPSEIVEALTQLNLYKKKEK